MSSLTNALADDSCTSSQRLTRLAGHRAVGHLRLNDVVQGSVIVLKGVESAEASNIVGAVERALDAADADCVDREDVDQTGKVRRLRPTP